MGGAFGRRTGIRWKKTERTNKCVRFLLFWSLFLRKRPQYESHGGRSRPDTAQNPYYTYARPALGHSKSALTQRRSISRTRVLMKIAPPPHHLNDHIKQISSERKNGVKKDEKKKRSQYRIKVLIALLWGAKSGGERESP